MFVSRFGYQVPLREWMTSERWTNPTLAVRVGVTRNQVKCVLRGSTPPSEQFIEGVCALSGLSPEELFTEPALAAVARRRSGHDRGAAVSTPSAPISKATSASPVKGFDNPTYHERGSHDRFYGSDLLLEAAAKLRTRGISRLPVDAFHKQAERRD